MDDLRRPLGTTGLRVHPLCLGGNVFGWTADEPTSFAVLDAYVAAGGNIVDTANIYSAWAPGNRGGESESILGRWLADRGRPDDLLLATKVGMAGGDMRKGLTRERVRRGLEGSLARLGVERIDLYYAHEDDGDTPLEETVAAFDELVREGLVGAVGASNYAAPRLAEALRVAGEAGMAPFTVLQPRYNLIDRDEFEGPLADLCRARGVAVAPYFGLARGFLAGTYRPGLPLRDSPRAAGVVREYSTPRAAAVLAAVDAVAAAHDATPAQVSLAWLTAQEGVATALASATSVAQVRELTGAAALRLSAEDLSRLAAAGA
jgi:aryl-alcohol dehydrogenase (NADP+)